MSLGLQPTASVAKGGVASGVAIVAASLIVVTPLAVSPPDLRPHATVAIPATQHTVVHDPQLLAVTLPLFLSQIFTSDLRDDYLSYALSGFEGSLDATTDYLQAAPAYFSVLANYVREDPRTLPSAVSRVVYDVVNIIDRESLTHQMSGPIIHRVLYPLLSEEAKDLFDGFLRTGDNVALGLLKLTLPEPLGADGSLPGLPPLVTTPWPHPFDPNSQYPPTPSVARQALTGPSAVPAAGSGTPQPSVELKSTPSVESVGGEQEITPKDEPAVDRTTRVVANTRSLPLGVFGQLPLGSPSAEPANSAATKPAWNPAADAARALGRVQAGISSTLTKISEGVKHTVSGGGTSTGAATSGDTP